MALSMCTVLTSIMLVYFAMGSNAKIHEVKPLYDDVTGAPLNDAARNILRQARESESKASKLEYVASNHQVLTVQEEVKKLDPVHIEPGVWKFVMIDISTPGSNLSSKKIVRSFANLHYHAEMYSRAFEHELKALNANIRVIGGGRIDFRPEEKFISVYGYSKTFGRAPGCNEATAKLIQERFPDFQVKWSDDGY
eukprot:CAMPEP_0197515796 /NCGR_PEP_ID=MMETSP1318-20131121/810_1 /TAXON_ID=552666 /ORGANISM="Partenskyella glossopodia, Strain RCC365" /LENGTH=194 /DNA_ID=CAMNT_0043064259 /DNA_START=1017 /DNA_END=1601 /DNA_ORIENTATION=+